MQYLLVLVLWILANSQSAGAKKTPHSFSILLLVLYAINHSLLPVFFVIFENIMSFSQRRIAARFTVWSIKNSMRVARSSTYSRSMKGDQGEHWRNECQWMKYGNSWGKKRGGRRKILPNSIFPLLVYSIYIFPYIFVLTCCTTNLCAILTNHFHG